MVEAVTAPADVEARVLAVVRELVAETGGERAVRAVTPQASLERDRGLGSLARDERLRRHENAFGRPLADGALEVDTPAGLAKALGGPVPIDRETGRSRGPALQPATTRTMMSTGTAFQMCPLWSIKSPRCHVRGCHRVRRIERLLPRVRDHAATNVLAG